jgi:hypothetical protein
MIDELIKSVERVEEDVQHKRKGEDELFRQLLHSYMIDFPQHELTGVA